jgi:hypothetical protein
MKNKKEIEWFFAMLGPLTVAASMTDDPDANPTLFVTDAKGTMLELRIARQHLVDWFAWLPVRGRRGQSAVRLPSSPAPRLGN